MINIRYHIVSITAVFLALGIGVALGSTFIEAATVDILNRNIRSAEDRINETSAENRELATRIEQSNARDTALSLLAGSDLLAGHLEAVPVVVVAPPGLDPALVVPVTTSLGWTEASVIGTIHLTEAMAFGDDPTPELDAALGLTSATADEQREAAYAALRAEIAAASVAEVAPEGDPDGEEVPDGTAPGAGDEATDPEPEPGSSEEGTGQAPVPGTTAPDAPTDPAATDGAEDEPSVVDALLATGHLRFEPGPAHAGGTPLPAGGGVRFVFLDQPGLDPAASELLIDLMPIEADRPVPVIVVASPSAPPSESLAYAVRTVREDARLASRYSTVDHLDTFAGLVATVFALERGPQAGADHHGHGDRATSVLAPPP
jgi:hypothetical protein